MAQLADEERVKWIHTRLSPKVQAKIARAWSRCPAQAGDPVEPIKSPSPQTTPSPAQEQGHEEAQEGGRSPTDRSPETQPVTPVSSPVQEPQRQQIVSQPIAAPPDSRPKTGAKRTRAQEPAGPVSKRASVEQQPAGQHFSTSSGRDLTQLLEGWKALETTGDPQFDSQLPELVQYEDWPLQAYDQAKLTELVRRDYAQFTGYQKGYLRLSFVLGRDLQAAYLAVKRDRNQPWKEWASDNVPGMSVSYIKKLRCLYKTLGPYPRFQGLNLPVRKLLGLCTRIAHHLDQADRAQAKYWRQAPGG
jgi:hypothetical protein